MANIKKQIPIIENICLSKSEFLDVKKTINAKKAPKDNAKYFTIVDIFDSLSRLS